MPRNPGARYSARPIIGRSGAGIPGSTDPDLDQALRLRRRNPEAFTAEHAAAYAAFAGITDRRTALNLHTHCVDWDAVDAYTAAGVGRDNFTAMCNLADHGITPAQYLGWADVQLGLTRMADCIHAGLSAAQVKSYLDCIPQSWWNNARLPDLVTSGMRPGRVEQFILLGVGNLPTLLLLHRIGARPRTIRGYIAASTTEPGTAEFARARSARIRATTDQLAGFRRAFTAATADTGDTELAEIVFTHGGGVGHCRRWVRLYARRQRNDTTLPPRTDLVKALLDAGYSCEEIEENPTLLSTPMQSLQVLAALRAA